MARKMHEKRPEEDNRYHDTWKLLKKYRDVTWSLEVSVRQVKNQFRIDYDCSIEDFLDSIYMAGADLGGTIIEDHAKCIERSYKMLTLLENAVNLLRTRHKNGEVYYWILYYSFLSPQKLKNVDEIIEVLRPHIRDISSSTYNYYGEIQETGRYGMWNYYLFGTLPYGFDDDSAINLLMLTAFDDSPNQNQVEILRKTAKPNTFAIIASDYYDHISLLPISDEWENIYHLLIRAQSD